MTVCRACGGSAHTERGEHVYVGCGLDNVTLIGVELSRCERCSHVEVGIPNPEGLHRAIALSLVQQPQRLQPKQIRFLRTYLGYSTKDFAPLIGKAPESVSRWENGQMEMDTAAERLLRLMVVHEAPLTEYPLSRLADVGGDDRAIAPLHLRRGKASWEPFGTEVTPPSNGKAGRRKGAGPAAGTANTAERRRLTNHH